MKKSLFGRFYKQQEMDKVSHNDAGKETACEFTSPCPPKQARTEYTVTYDHCGKSKFDFPPLTFPISPPSVLSSPQKSVELMFTAKRGGFQDENPPEQPQDAKLNVTPVTDATTSHCRMTHTRSHNEGFFTAERHSLALSDDEHLPVTETDASSYFPGDDSDVSRHSSSNQPGESLEEETPGDCSLSTGNEQDERQVQNQAISCGAQSKEVTRQSDCTQKDNHSNASSEVSEANQKRGEFKSSDTSLSEKEDKRSIPLSGPDNIELCQNSEEKNIEITAQAEKHAQIEFEIPEKEYVSSCYLEIKGQVNETDCSEKVLLSDAECAEESVFACDVVSDSNKALENVCFEVDDFCGAKGATAAGKIIAEAPSEKADHTTETAMPARISQERAGGDNDADPFGVIDPTIWNGTHREAEEKCCNSEIAACAGLSPSVNIHEMEAPYSDVRPLSLDGGTQLNHQSTTWHDEDEDFCQSCSITNNPQIVASIENSCQWNFSITPLEWPAAHTAQDDSKLKSLDAVGHELKEQSASSCFLGGITHSQVEISQCENDKTTEIKEHVESFMAETTSDQHHSLESETCESDRNSKLLEEAQENKLKYFSDLPLTTDVSSGDKGVKDQIETDEHGDLETPENCDVKQDQHTTEGIQWSPGGRTDRKNVTLCNENNQEYDCQLTGGIKKKLLDFTLSPGSDALVPNQRHSSLSQNAHHSSFAVNCNRFSPLTSASNLNSHALGGFDTFQKIPLTQSDDDNYIVGLDDLACVPVLGSSPHQMLESPQLQLNGGVASEDTGLVCSDSSQDELPNFISGADVSAVEPHCCELAHVSLDHLQHSDSSAVSTGSNAPSSDVNIYHQFDMKEQFDMVLKELQLFFDISRNEFAEHYGGTSKPLEGNASVHRHPSSPEVEQQRDTSSDDVYEDPSLATCGGHPTVHNDGEQEVPVGSHLCQEKAQLHEEPCREHLKTQQKRKMWSPSFGSEPFLEQLSHRLLEPPKRLAPLKTCTGPRRVGLSRRVRTKPLHHPHPLK